MNVHRHQFTEPSAPVFDLLLGEPRELDPEEQEDAPAEPQDMRS